jgi:hypothetical protein
MTLLPCHGTQHLDERLEDGEDGKGVEGVKGVELLERRADTILCHCPRQAGDAPAIKPGPG